MGTGKVIKCKECGYELNILEGVGLENNPVQPQGNIKCPQCGSEEFEDTDVVILWD